MVIKIKVLDTGKKTHYSFGQKDSITVWEIRITGRQPERIGFETKEEAEYYAKNLIK